MPRSKSVAAWWHERPCLMRFQDGPRRCFVSSVDQEGLLTLRFAEGELRGVSPQDADLRVGSSAASFTGTGFATPPPSGAAGVPLARVPATMRGDGRPLSAGDSISYLFYVGGRPKWFAATVKSCRGEVRRLVLLVLVVLLVLLVLVVLLVLS